MLGPDDHRDAFASDDPGARPARLGRPAAAERRARDPRRRRASRSRPGERGEIWVRGEQVSGEYLGRSALTDDGWFPTATAATSTRTASCSSRAGSTTSSSAAARTSRRARSRTCCSSIRPSTRRRSSACPTTEWGEAVAAAVVLEPGQRVTDDELQEWVREPAALDQDARA